VFISSSAQSSEVRTLEDTTPKHVPIKLKIRKEKEKAFKDLKNEHWLRDLEIEVTNSGDKPIYFLSVVLTMVGVRAPDGNEYGFPLHYGKAWHLSVPPGPNDIPLQPGETYIFRIPVAWIKGWETDKRYLQPKQVRVTFQKLNFGDGTGFFDSGGTPMSRAVTNHLTPRLATK
jgi:hypothetical protein